MPNHLEGKLTVKWRPVFHNRVVYARENGELIDITPEKLVSVGLGSHLLYCLQGNREFEVHREEEQCSRMGNFFSKPCDVPITLAPIAIAVPGSASCVARLSVSLRPVPSPYRVLFLGACPSWLWMENRLKRNAPKLEYNEVRASPTQSIVEGTAVPLEGELIFKELRTGHGLAFPSTSFQELGARLVQLTMRQFNNEHLREAVFQYFATPSLNVANFYKSLDNVVNTVVPSLDWSACEQSETHPAW